MLLSVIVEDYLSSVKPGAASWLRALLAIFPLDAYP